MASAGAITDARWDPSATALGDEVTLRVTTRGFPPGTTVQLSVRVRDDRGRVVEVRTLATLTTTTDAEGNASARWRIPTPGHEYGGAAFQSPAQARAGTGAREDGRGQQASHACLETFPDPPNATLETPARDLNLTDARNIVLYLIKQGRVRLFREEHQLEFAPDCSVIWPGPRAADTADRPRWDAVRDRITIEATIHTPHGDVDPRIVVLLYELAKHLRETWGVQEIYHLGFAGDDNHPPWNCHNLGRALDFAGLAGVTPPARGPMRRYLFTVLNDWGRQPVPLPYQEPVAGLQPPAEQQGHHYHWPAEDQAPEYRFSAEIGSQSRRSPPLRIRGALWPDRIDGQLFPRPSPTTFRLFRLGPLKEARPHDAELALKFDIFSDLYAFLAGRPSDANMRGQATDSNRRRGRLDGTTIVRGGGQRQEPPTTIDHSNFIVIPDQPDPALRVDHRNHIHVQVGPTGWEDPPPIDDTEQYWPVSDRDADRWKNHYWGGDPARDQIQQNAEWQSWWERHHGRLWVTVRDPRQVPIDGATVVVQPPGGGEELTRQTDTSGNAAFSEWELRAGSDNVATFSVQKEGFSPVTRQERHIYPATNTVAVTLQQLWFIVRVRDSGGGAIYGAEVTIQPAGGEGSVHGSSNVLGYAYFPGLPEGTVTVSVDAAGYDRETDPRGQVAADGTGTVVVNLSTRCTPEHPAGTSDNMSRL